MKIWKRLTITHPLHAFGLTWFGQLISLLGSGLTSFGLGVMIFQTTGSTTQFSIFTFCAIFPTVLLSPFAGALIDRWDRRYAMLLSDLGCGFSSFLIWLLLAAGQTGRWPIQTWYFNVPVALGAAFSAFRLPAYYAATTLLVPRQHLTRANGLVELSTGASQMIAPVLAGALVARIGLRGILVIDLATFVFAISSLMLVRFPAAPVTASGQAARGSLWREIAHGWSFIRTRPGLYGMLLFVVAINVILSMVSLLITPLVLSFTDAATLGIILSTAGVGMLVGGIVISVWGGPRKRVRGAVGFFLLSGASLFLAGLPPTALLVGLGGSLFLFTIPIVSSCLQTVWQTKVAPDMQGRVFAVRRMVTLSAPPVASVLAAVLTDHLFEPWLAPGGALASTVGRVIGTGPGRGIGFLFMVLGVMVVLIAGVTWLSPRVRNVEEELPDALPPTVPAAGEATAPEEALPSHA